MSYCRWSSDGWKSDVYVYESEVGFEIHVATRKVVHSKECPKLDFTSPKFEEQYEAEMEWLDESEMEPLGLPSDGESYTLSTPNECIDKLLELRKEGYHIPQYAINNLKEENNAL
jgi:hypothetical protein